MELTLNSLLTVGLGLAIAASVPYYFLHRKKSTKPVQKLNICILGYGRIGATVALHFARYGHNVTVVGRGTFLQQLRKDDAHIVTTDGERVKVTAHDKLDTSVEYDLLLVTVLAHQLDPILADIISSKAKSIMFMFNTFQPLNSLRDAVGPSRFEFGFPGIGATFVDGKLSYMISKSGVVTTLTSPRWVQTFTDAGIPAVVTDDMESWLFTHAVAVLPFIVGMTHSYVKNEAFSWSFARELTAAAEEGFQLVQDLGYKIIPFPLPQFQRFPVILTLMLWLVSRVPSLREQGKIGTTSTEPEALFTAVENAAKGRDLPRLQKLKSVYKSIVN
jgi:2-dehydropantoate 2-reductase